MEFLFIMSLFMVFNPIFLILVFIVVLLFSCLVSVFIINTYFYSYLIFMLFMSGVVVVIMYLCGVILIEKIAFSMSSLYLLMLLMSSVIISKFDFLGSYMGNLLKMEETLNYGEFFNVLKFLMYSFNIFSLFFILYLFLCLIVVYEIVKNCNGPLRMKT